jgi:hypothetical protein
MRRPGHQPGASVLAFGADRGRGPGIAALAGKNRLSKATPPVPQEAVRGLKADLLTPSAQVTTRCLDSLSH